ncbi:MAG: SdrD B-like domain-containing protein, partial [Spirochaetota bacterium]
PAFAPPNDRTISGFAFLDGNDNGVKDNGEASIPGITVTATRDGKPADTFTATTDANGAYTFAKLYRETYSLTAGDKDGHYHTSSASLASVDATPNPADKNFGYDLYRSIAGYAFFDANGNGRKDADEPGIGGVGLTAVRGTQTLSASSATDGAYQFARLFHGTYTVSSAELTGLVRTSPASIAVDNSANPTDINFGYALDLAWIQSQPVNGFSHGYWKSNLDKAIKGTTKGVQVSAATLTAYVGQISTFALAPLNVTSWVDASAVLSATGSGSSLLLSKQLLGSEFNYSNGAFFGGLALPTSLFLYQGEYMLAHPAEFSAAQFSAAQGLSDKYNNTHGGTMLAPLTGL